MPPAQIAALVLQYGLQYGPEIMMDVHAILTKADPSSDDFLALAGKMKSYDEYRAEANLRAGKPANAPVSYVDDVAPPWPKGSSSSSSSS